jgi:hypothetical protein
MKKLLVAALIVPVALLGAARPAKAHDKAAAILAGVAVGIGAAVLLDAIAPRPVVAAPVVYAPPPAPVIVQTSPLVVYTPPPVVVTPPPVVYTPPPVVYQPAPVVYGPVPVIVGGPRYVAYASHPPYYRGNGHWKRHHKHDDD